MEPTKFVELLADLAPSATELERVGVTGSHAEHFRRSFRCPVRRSDRKERNEILALLNGWDLTHVEIGMIRFAPNPEQLQGRIRVGTVEADPLLIIDDAGEVVVEELGASGHILWAVAAGSSMFLDALIPAAEFLSRRMVGAIDLEDMKRARATAEQCASMAGGERYLPFYLMLLGAE
jgi:hypothetical protein